jgi:plasmid stabilization system protein ParE
MRAMQRLQLYSQNMGYKIRFKEGALRQLDSLYHYIATESPGNAEMVLYRVNAVFKRLKAQPLLGKLTDQQYVHCVVVSKTGLLVFYTFDTDTITVVRVLHERQGR